MSIKWVIGKKTNYFIAGIWTLTATINFIEGDWQVGALELLLALNSLTDAFRGEEVVALDFKIGKDVK